MSRPDISFIVPSHNVQRYIEAAIHSALAQEHVSVEVIVVDDASTDGSAAVAERLAESDSRIRVFRQEKAGPSAARNMAIDAARGQWVAPLDADDLITPRRSRQLIDLAAQGGYHIAADNMTCFLDEDDSVRWPFLPMPDVPTQLEVGLSDYLMRNRLLRGDQNLGYLKPIFRRSFLDQNGLRYDGKLRIGEDFDLCLRCLAQGARYTITTEPGYLYRIRGGSLSRQLTPADLQQMLIAYENTLPPGGDSLDQQTRVAQHAYRQSLDTALAYTEFRSTIRAREWRSTARIAVTRPRVWSAIGRLAVSKLKQRASLRAARTQIGR